MIHLVHILDGDHSFRTSASQILRVSGFDAVTYSDVAELLVSPLLEQRGCVLLDMQMPGSSGRAFRRGLAARAPLLPIIPVVGLTDVAKGAALDGSAVDVLEKPVSGEALVGVVGRALELYEARRAQREQQVRLRALVATLTSRESRVFWLLARGTRRRQIAHELGTSERAIQAFGHNVAEKLGVDTLAEFASIAEHLSVGEGATVNRARS